MNEQDIEKQLLTEDDSLKKLYAELLKARYENEIERTKTNTYEIKRAKQDAMDKREKSGAYKIEEF